MTFVHPGRLYLETHKVEAIDDVLPYAEFLRAEAGIMGELPVNLDLIREHFEMPQPLGVSLPNQQALLLDSESGTILLNLEDPLRRKRFSFAHELVEMLFSALPQGNGLVKKPGGFREQRKEKICDLVAANLLMPPVHIQQLIKTDGVSFETAKLISAQCEVSRTAALVQLARLSPRKHCVILWRMKNKPSEIQNAPNDQQMSLFDVKSGLPPKKFRVVWSIGGSNTPFIPKDKSTEKGSLVFQAWERDIFTSGKERMTFNNKTAGWFFSENMPFENGNERCVISLVEQISNQVLVE